jgi:hypothetical protein
MFGSSTDGASGGVAGVGRGRHAGRFALLVPSEKCCCGHDYFAAHFKVWREFRLREPLRGNRQWHRADGAYVAGYVFADGAVAAGERSLQVRRAVGGLVVKRHGEAVQLVFADIAYFGTAGKFMHAPVPIAELFFAVDVVERQHGAGMRQLGEAGQGLAAYALGRGVGRDQLGVFGLNALELAHEHVEGGVGDLGRVEDVVLVFVMANLVAQFFDVARVRG